MGGNLPASLRPCRSRADTAYDPGMSDSSRTLYLVCYDIASPKRLYRVHKFLLAYKVGGQKSFYECWLTPAELRGVTATLGELIDPDEDRVHIFQLDPRLRCEGLGLAQAPRTDVFLIL